MKLRKSYGVGVALAALASFGLTSKAQAILLQYETGPQAGQIFQTGGIKIKLAGVAAGTVYNSFGANGTTVGVASDTSAAAGITAMNGIAGQVGPAGSTIAGEDTWGIFTITAIYSTSDAIHPIWTSAVKGYEINAIFFGEKDYWATQTGATTQLFNGVGLQANFYIDPLGSYAPGNPNNRVGNNFNAITSGTLMMSTTSVAGFINGAGQNGGSAATYADSFDGAAGGGGQTFLDVTGGSDSSQFNTNTIQSAFNPNLFTDIQANFSTSTDSVPAGWLINIDDPLKTSVVPEPATALAGLACMLPMLGIMLRRQRQQALPAA